MPDLRLPIGGLFGLIGALLLLYGATHAGDAALQPTGIPIVTIWGAVLLVVGLAFLAGGWRASRGAK
jgi:hypothetical protein